MKNSFVNISAILIVLGLSLFPLIINGLYYIKTDIQILHKPSDWTSFWGTYLAAIASFAMVLITWLTLRQNRKQQVFYIKQSEQQKLQSQLEKLFNFQACINEMECVNCFTHIMEKKFDVVDVQVQNLIRDFDEKAFAVDIAISIDPKNQAQNEFHKLYNSIYAQYGSLIQDISWLNNLIKNMPNEETGKDAYLKYHLDNYSTIYPKNCIVETILKITPQLDVVPNLREIISKTLQNSTIGQLKEELKPTIISYREQEIKRIETII